MLELDDFDVGRVGHVERRDDARQPAQVVGVVGDHERVVARVHVDGVVRRNQRAQHRQQAVGRLVVQAKDLRDDLVARGRAGAADGGVDGAGLQLGVGLGHHFVQAVGFHHREALQAQRGGELVEGGGRCQRAVGDQVHGALDARIDHHVAPRDHGHGAGHGLDVGGGKVERDRFAAPRGVAGLRVGGRQHRHERRRDQQAHRERDEAGAGAGRGQRLLHGRINPG
ncbi:hypothetical protein D9M68_664880 [compost metagenome]